MDKKCFHRVPRTFKDRFQLHEFYVSGSKNKRLEQRKSPWIDVHEFCVLKWGFSFKRSTLFYERIEISIKVKLQKLY